MREGIKRRLIRVTAAAVIAAQTFLPMAEISALEMNIPEDIDGNSSRAEFYYEAAELVSDYWENDYYEERSYTKKTGAARVKGKWYLPAEDFEDFEASYIYKGKKMVPLSDIKGSSLYEIDSSTSEVSIARPYQLKRLIVKMKNGRISPGNYGATDYVKNGEDGVYILQFDSEEATKKAYKKLNSRAKVEYVEADRYISMIEPEDIADKKTAVDSLTSDNKEVSYTDAAATGTGYAGWEQEMLGTDILAERIKNSENDGSVTVAVVDTGIDYTHEYLADSVVSTGYDFINNDYDAYDDNSHGTHVAGIIKNTACGADVKLLPVKVLSGQGNGSSLTVSNGIMYAARNGADVINLSLGGASYGSGHYEDQAVADAISMGVTVVAAAGNDSSDTAYFCPAHNTNAIVVSAIDRFGERAYFSNYGNSVDVAAPGVDILSSVPGNSYEYFSGTSMAAPHISGVAALIKLVCPLYTCSDVEKTICDCAYDLGSAGWDHYYGYGVPNVSNLDIPDAPLPSVSPTVTPTAAPKPTEVPTWPPYNPVPTQSPKPTGTPAYEDASLSISTSCGYSNGYKTASVSITAGKGIKKVRIESSDGKGYDINNPGNGINEMLSYKLSGFESLTLNIYGYDRNGNCIQSSMITI